MKTSADVIEAIKNRVEPHSYYRVSKVLGIPATEVSSIKAGRRYLTEKQALRAAEVLQCEPAIIIAVAAADRCKTHQGKESMQRRKEVTPCILC